MAGTLKLIAPPAYITTSAANVYTPPASTIYSVLRHMHFCNVTTGAQTFSMYVGVTTGSTGGQELFKNYSIAANSTFDYYCTQRMSDTQFLSAIATSGSAITVTVEGEQNVV